MTEGQALDDFETFWRTHFPEQETLSRAEALARVDDQVRGGLNTTSSDADMAAYQDDVAQVYGAYEGARFQLATMGHLVSLVRKLPDQVHIISLGCGPASYELWLASKTRHLVTLVDYSPGMLARASAIATTLGVANRITMIESDARSIPSIKSRCARLVLCINSMHWSRNWRQWISEAARIGANSSLVFITCTFGHPRSEITPESLGQEINRFFLNKGANFLVPPVDVGDGLVAMSSRFYVIGRSK